MKPNELKRKVVRTVESAANDLKKKKIDRAADKAAKKEARQAARADRREERREKIAELKGKYNIHTLGNKLGELAGKPIGFGLGKIYGATTTGVDATKGVFHGAKEAFQKSKEKTKAKRETLKEATKASTEEGGETANVVNEAINKNANNNANGEKTRTTQSFNSNGVNYERKQNPNWKDGDKRSEDHHQFIYYANGQEINGEQYGKAKAEFVNGGGTVDINEEEITIFSQLHDAWDGIPDWAKLTGVGVAGGIAGGVIFGGHDDDD